MKIDIFNVKKVVRVNQSLTFLGLIFYACIIVKQQQQKRYQS